MRQARRLPKRRSPVDDESDGAAARPGRRERNKECKLERITEAARAVFTARGFDDATLRDIAQRADVGLGTLFSYASSKRDLVFMLFIEPLEQLAADTFARVPRNAAFTAQLTEVFAPHYAFFDRNHVLSRILLREIFFHTEGASAQRFQRHWQDMIHRLEALVRDAQKSGCVVRDADAAGVARIVFAVYQAEVRRWLAETRPKRTAGMARLNSLLALSMRGFSG